MFKKILIANRGEIAGRVIRTCQRMGIATVAVYSDADRFTRPVLDADEAVRLGPAPAAQSYLYVDAVIAACKATGAEASIPAMDFSRKMSASPSGSRRTASLSSGQSRSICARSASNIRRVSWRRPAACPFCPDPACSLMSMPR